MSNRSGAKIVPKRSLLTTACGLSRKHATDDTTSLICEARFPHSIGQGLGAHPANVRLGRFPPVVVERPFRNFDLLEWPRTPGCPVVLNDSIPLFCDVRGHGLILQNVYEVI